MKSNALCSHTSNDFLNFLLLQQVIQKNKMIIAITINIITPATDEVGTTYNSIILVSLVSSVGVTVGVTLGDMTAILELVSLIVSLKHIASFLLIMTDSLHLLVLYPLSDLI